MVSEVRIYVEGGGDRAQGKADIRRGFREFLKSASKPGARPRIVACGGRQQTFKAFKMGLASHPNAFNVLLVDSEGPVNASPWRHLKDRDGWDAPGCPDDNCHLMVQEMEAWIVADPDALQCFYGNGFNRSVLPGAQDVESVPKSTLADSLKRATKDTTAGEYHKLRHGPRLIGRLAPDRVRQRARHCDRLFKTLADAMA